MQVSGGKLSTSISHIEFSGDVRHLASPEVQGKFAAHVSADEAARIMAWRVRQTGIVDAFGDFRFHTPEDYLVTGKQETSGLSYRDTDLHFDHVRVLSNFSARPKQIELSNMRASFTGGQAEGRVVLNNLDRFEVKGKLMNFDALAVVRVAPANRPPIDARFSGPFEASGSLSGLEHRRLDASAQLTLSAAGSTPINGFLDAHYDGARQYVDFAKSFISLSSSRVDFSGGLSVPPGHAIADLQVRIASGNLDDALPFFPGIKSLPATLQKGHAEFNGTVQGPLESPAIVGHVTANNILIEKQSVDAVSADINARRTQLQVRNGVLAYQNMRARISGSLGLQDWKAGNQSAVSATTTLQNADITQLLALLGQNKIPVKGSISAEAQVNGTLADPHATATLRGGKGSAYGEPFDRLTANVTYVSGGLQEFQGAAVSGSRQIDLNGTYRPSPADFLAGLAQAHIKTSDLALNQIQAIRQYQPEIGGVARGTADAEFRLIHGKAGEQFEIVSLSGDVITRNLTIERKPLGDVHITARTSPGQNPPLLTAKLESDLAHSIVRGSGSWRLAGNYPGSGELTFNDVNLAEVRRIFLPQAASLALAGGSVEGKITFSGPATNLRSMTGTLEIPKLEIRPEPGAATPIPASLRDVVIRNEGPIVAAMSNGNIRVEAARVTARSTDISLAGNINLNAASPLNLRASGNLNLAIVQMIAPDFVSSGTVASTATIRGTFTQPEIAGRLEVKNANLNFEGLPNGLSDANGTILFDGSRATIEKLSAETGGGRVNLGGFASFGNGPLAFRLEADAKGVRVRYPEGVSTVANASLRLIGTAERSTLSGTITVLRSAFTPHTDLGSLLAHAAAPVQTPAVQTGLVGNMQFDVDVQTAPDVSLQTSIAQGLQVDANLRLRGTLSNPVVLGRVNISQGDLTFFGNKYTINEGSISFLNPVKLDPILDVSLETRARGVDVTINVTGPLTKLNVSYRSDPPLQFSDLVALLATGRTPENPTLAARDTGTPQTWQGMGASALLGQAISNPLAGRLQRFFGVSKIKIDPLLTGVAGNAQARLTIEQNVTPDLTFTYITNVASSTGSAQVIRVEWDFSRHWSAVAVRDEYGYFGMDFQYRKRLK